MFIGCVVAPRGNQGHMIGQRDCFEAWHSDHNRVFGKIECEMRGGGRTPSIPHDEEAMPIMIGLLQQLQYTLKMWQRDLSHHLLKLAEVIDHCLQRFLLPLALTDLYQCLLWCIWRNPEMVEICRYIQNNRCPLLVKMKVHTLQPSLLQGACDALLLLLLTVEHEKTSSTCTCNLAPTSPIM